MSNTPSPALTTQPSTPAKVTEQGQQSEEVSNGKITGEEATDQGSETRNPKDTDADMGLGEGTSNAASDEPSGSDPAPSASKSKPKSAFVKVMELKEKEMLTAYLEAFFGEPYDVYTRPSVLPVGSPR